MASRICCLILRSLLLLFFICQVSGDRILLPDSTDRRFDDFRVVYYAVPNTDTPSILYGGPARFGVDLGSVNAVESTVQHVEPLDGCTDIVNNDTLRGKIAIVQRGNCQFAEKALNIQKTGAVGAIVIDYNRGLNAAKFPVFIMGSGSVTETITIPLVFLYDTEGQQLLNASSLYPNLMVGISGSRPASVPRTEEIVTATPTTEENNLGHDFSVSPEEQQQQQRPEKARAEEENETQLSTLYITLICVGVLVALTLLAVSLGCWYRSTRKKSGGSPDEIQFSRLRV